MLISIVSAQEMLKIVIQACLPESLGAARTLWNERRIAPISILFNLPQGFLGEVRA
jgi:hypothetical protein